MGIWAEALHKCRMSDRGFNEFKHKKQPLELPRAQSTKYYSAHVAKSRLLAKQAAWPDSSPARAARYIAADQYPRQRTDEAVVGAVMTCVWSGERAHQPADCEEHGILKQRGEEEDRIVAAHGEGWERQPDQLMMMLAETLNPLSVRILLRDVSMRGGGSVAWTVGASPASSSASVLRSSIEF
jgi:hypothetical protein